MNIFINVIAYLDLFFKLIRICGERVYFNLGCFVKNIFEINLLISIKFVLKERYWDSVYDKYKTNEIKLAILRNSLIGKE